MILSNNSPPVHTLWIYYIINTPSQDIHFLDLQKFQII